MQKLTKKIIFTNGCFDILHRGHLSLFSHCKNLGDILIVGIDSDERVKFLKGDSRPINNQKDRKYMLESLVFIDEVYIFNSELELENLIEKFNPDIMIVGADYRDKRVVGSQFSKQLRFFDKISGYSTTKIIQSINNR